MKKRTKIAVGVTAIVVVVGIAAVASANQGGSGVAVRMEAVAQRDLVATVTANGWIRPHRRVDVQADVMGRVIELNVKEGQRVTRGQVLLRIDPAQLEAAASRAEAAVQESMAREAQTRANLMQAERAYERLSQLGASDQNLVSRQQIEEAETQVAVQRQLLVAAGHGVAQARSALAEARDRLSKTVIRAPMDGVVTRLNVEEGSTAIVGTMNNPGSLLLTIADLTTMEAVVRVDETDVPRLQVGDSAIITIDAFTRQKFTGRVTEIGYSAVRSPLQQGAQATAAQGQAIDYEVVITLDEPPESLRSDLSVSADIVTDKRTGALAIPIIALTVRERAPESEAVPVEDPETAAAAAALVGDTAKVDLEGVFVVRDGKAVFVPVNVGIAGNGYFEVLSGLSTQDTVVAGPYDAIRTLEDGSPVRPTAAPAGSATGTTTTARGS
ncbi:MAG TPA: efflux RND transporter periplasmic adaptor subunit [Longimicrobiales bacterium]|nr:efflux RND transporter periplasmic adaptor subunit [Longimicrobiales bacterium]